MALNKSSNNMSTVALMVAVLLLASQITASTAKGMIEGTVNPTEGGVPAATEDVRPTNPSHSPGIGHAFTNNKIGRKLLAKAEGTITSTSSTGMIEGTITPTEGGGNQGATEDVRPTNPSHSPGIGHAFTNNKIGRKLLTV
ncbi:hypothetical protein C2845_PM02G24170 [Panicum miliaceum]|uniref:Uncharacterized protein n=1 Tax=Panicum miliaceum TaxID=4540 RepID=A0A3L6SCE9_PANMI|nr:hypothetical protein C2845_PM02G24170 [Panicum miliaceum]